jgi:hypothetical protein
LRQEEEAMEALIAPLSVIFIAALIAAPSIWLAHRRGRSVFIWGALGLLLPLVSILFLLILPAKHAEAY